MFDTILIAAALADEGHATRAMTAQAQEMLNPGGKIVFVHVLDEVPKYAAAHVPRQHMSKHEQKVTDLLTRIASEVEGASTEVVVRKGSASAGILGTAKQTKADVILIASHKPGLGDYFIGSTAARVVRHADTSVMVLR